MERPARAVTAWARMSGGAILALLLVGCVAPAEQFVLGEARTALEQARSAPRVRALAAAELDCAELAFANAQAAAKAGAPASHVDHLAELAIEQAALAAAHADARVARSEIEVLRQALGPLLADETVAASADGRGGGDASPAAMVDATPGNLTLRLAGLTFDDAAPSGETANQLDQTAGRLTDNPARTVSIEADFGVPDPVAQTEVERRVELVRAELLRRGIEPSRITVRASAPRNVQAMPPTDRRAP
jgi:outer membrane protein OmpA-like peptidoglycan-associated protein